LKIYSHSFWKYMEIYYRNFLFQVLMFPHHIPSESEKKKRQSNFYMSFYLYSFFYHGFCFVIFMWRNSL
jgi:hypothetical protein